MFGRAYIRALAQQSAASRGFRFSPPECHAGLPEPPAVRHLHGGSGSGARKTAIYLQQYEMCRSIRLRSTHLHPCSSAMARHSTGAGRNRIGRVALLLAEYSWAVLRIVTYAVPRRFWLS